MQRASRSCAPVRRTLIQSHKKLAFEVSDVPHVTDLEGERTT